MIDYAIGLKGWIYSALDYWMECKVQATLPHLFHTFFNATGLPKQSIDQLSFVWPGQTCS
jgi:hypothetical protein